MTNSVARTVLHYISAPLPLVALSRFDRLVFILNREPYKSDFFTMA